MNNPEMSPSPSRDDLERVFALPAIQDSERNISLENVSSSLEADVQDTGADRLQAREEAVARVSGKASLNGVGVEVASLDDASPLLNPNGNLEAPKTKEYRIGADGTGRFVDTTEETWLAKYGTPHTGKVTTEVLGDGGLVTTTTTHYSGGRKTGTTSSRHADIRTAEGYMDFSHWDAPDASNPEPPKPGLVTRSVEGFGLTPSATDAKSQPVELPAIGRESEIDPTIGPIGEQIKDAVIAEAEVGASPEVTAYLIEATLKKNGVTNYEKSGQPWSGETGIVFVYDSVRYHVYTSGICTGLVTKL